MRKILTISIAAYNVEQYIEQALDSLIDERIIDDLEIFVVDDGGTDKTLEIAKRYAEKYPQSIFPIHKENGGYGSTVNYSIEHASGKYIKLLDGDDWFDTNGLAVLVEALKTISSDVVITNKKRIIFDEKSKRIQEYIASFAPYGVERKISEIDIKAYFTMGEICWKTKVVRKSGLQLPEHMLYTDQYWATVPFAFADTISCYDIFVYCYRIGREGQSVDIVTRAKHLPEEISTTTDLIRFYENNKKCNNNQYLLLSAASWFRLVELQITKQPLCRENKKIFVSFDKEIREISPTAYKASGSLGKLGLLLRFIRITNYMGYWMLIFIHKKLQKMR